MLYVASIAVLVSACTQPNLDSQVTGVTAQGGQVASRDMNKYPINKLVCDPLGGSPGTRLKNGIEASLAFRGATQPRWYSTQDYLNQGVKSDKTLFFTDLFVPSRMFTQGFATQTSSVVQNDLGEKLIEYFGMRFKTELRLKAEQNSGLYDIAVLADDGVRISTIDAQGKTTFINGDGDHSTRMSCGEPLNMAHNIGKTIEIDYYQGPRYHIALVMLWRPAQSGKDPSCDKQGTHLYFDPDKNSQPKLAYTDLLARGWTPIPAENFYLPDQVEINPCNPGEPLQLDGPYINEVFFNQVDVSWTTSRAATTQVLVKDIETGAETLTESDNRVRTSHQMSVTGLTSGKTYTIRAVSVAEDGGRVISIPKTVTLPTL